jgi:hypothetical protein
VEIDAEQGKDGDHRSTATNKHENIAIVSSANVANHSVRSDEKVTRLIELRFRIDETLKRTIQDGRIE